MVTKLLEPLAPSVEALEALRSLDRRLALDRMLSTFSTSADRLDRATREFSSAVPAVPSEPRHRCLTATARDAIGATRTCVRELQRLLATQTADVSS